MVPLGNVFLKCSSVPNGRLNVDSSTTGTATPSTCTLSMRYGGRLCVSFMRENTSFAAESFLNGEPGGWRKPIVVLVCCAQYRSGPIKSDWF